MAKSSDSRKLEALEAEYTDVLVQALQSCAGGHWGLFGQNDEPIRSLRKSARERYASHHAEDLLALGDRIARLRSKLGYEEPFALHARLVKTRSLDRANAPGEPKLARQWLNDLGV